MSVKNLFKSILFFILMLVSLLCAFISFWFVKDVEETVLFIFTNIFLTILPIGNLILWIRSNKDYENLLITMSVFVQLILSIFMLFLFAKVINVLGIFEIFTGLISFLMLFVHLIKTRRERNDETREVSDLLSVFLMTLTIYFSVINLTSTSDLKSFLYILSSVALILLALGNCLSWFDLRFELFFFSFSWYFIAVFAIVIALAQTWLAFLMFRYFACEEWLIIFFLSGLEALFQIFYIIDSFRSGRSFLVILFFLLLNAPWILGTVFAIRDIFFLK